MLSRIVERSVVFCAALAGCLLLWRLFWFDLLPDDFGMPDYEHELEGLAMVTSRPGSSDDPVHAATPPPRVASD